MQTLLIEDVSRESAEGFRAALSEFETALVHTETGGYRVEVALAGSDRAIVKVLRALEDYVTERANGPARLKLEGRRYAMHPQPQLEPSKQIGNAA